MVISLKLGKEQMDLSPKGFKEREEKRRKILLILEKIKRNY